MSSYIEFSSSLGIGFVDPIFGSVKEAEKELELTVNRLIVGYARCLSILNRVGGVPFSAMSREEQTKLLYSWGQSATLDEIKVKIEKAQAQKELFTTK